MCFSHSVFWDLYCAAPERRDSCEHSSEAKAFHDYVSDTVLFPAQQHCFEHLYVVLLCVHDSLFANITCLQKLFESTITVNTHFFNSQNLHIIFHMFVNHICRNTYKCKYSSQIYLCSKELFTQLKCHDIILHNQGCDD